MSDDLARRAVACSAWRWVPGMLTQHHDRVIDGTGVAVVDGSRLIAPALDRAWTVPAREVAALPDLDDPATVGCLLALAREAWDDCEAFVGRRAGFWTFETLNPLAPLVTAPTEAAALVAALEAAP